jgi:hypothetical protein
VIRQLIRKILGELTGFIDFSTAATKLLLQDARRVNEFGLM